MVLPAPDTANGPNPSDWCRPFMRAPRYGALINGEPASVERVWANRSLRRVTHAEYAFRIGPLHRWARANPDAPEARPDQPVDLAALPPLY